VPFALGASIGSAESPPAALLTLGTWHLDAALPAAPRPAPGQVHKFIEF
jgi:hypothetical protein